eukprot:12634026-Alexandrium_andersonii.AAC.1
MALGYARAAKRKQHAADLCVAPGQTKLNWCRSSSSTMRSAVSRHSAVASWLATLACTRSSTP